VVDELGRKLLDETDQALAAVSGEVPFMHAGMGAYLQGGKRLRAKLLVAVATKGPSPRPRDIVRYAVFVELIHAGGLCHDDVVDRSTTRRARPSIGHLLGEPAAAAAGLYLMARAFEQVASDESCVRRWVGDVAARVARGQAREMTDLYSQNVSVDEYLKRVLDKTGALFQLACILGAEAGGFGDDVRHVLSAYAAHVGTAFQLADDLRDILGGPFLGREPGTDIREGVYTLPVLLTFIERRERGEELRQRLRDLRWGKDRDAIRACCDLVIQNGAVDAATKILDRCVGEGIRAASSLEGDLSGILEVFARGVNYDLPVRSRAAS